MTLPFNVTYSAQALLATASNGGNARYGNVR